MLNYGIIGNCKTCALISSRAAIAWFCFPDFSSPSVFARILDKDKGGSFEIHTKGRYKTSQKYVEHTNILETYFESERASFVVVDFFPRYRKLIPNRKRKVFRQNRLVRILKPLKGKPIIKINYDPELDYARSENKFEVVNGNLVVKNNDLVLSLISNVDYDSIMKKDFFELNHTKYFIIGGEDKPEYFNVTHCLRLMNATKRYWKRWVSSLVLPERNRELIIRSALVLKLLTFSETGALIAAPTTSIPEEIGSERNWDYRFCWIRDASFAVDALKKIGRDHEAKKLMNFVFDNTIKKKQNMQIMYGINGETDLKEQKLGHLAGFMNSKPVRIGNAAFHQKQNDIYGSIIDVIYLYYVYYGYEKKMPEKFWIFLRYLMKQIKMHWKEKDHGIWEFRGVQKHFTYSKLMCCVGADRAVRIAQHYNKHKLAEKWVFLRDEIKKDIMDNAWSEKKRTFTMSYEGEDLDAALLMMSYHEFLEPSDPRLISTIRAIDNNLKQGFLVKRYEINDDFGKSKSSFTICAFWFIDALYMSGEIEKAQNIFKKLVKCSNHLGLFSEDTDVKTKKLLGNFPQAYTHLALINTAILLSEWSVKRKKIDFSSFPSSIRIE